MEKDTTNTDSGDENTQNNNNNTYDSPPSSSSPSPPKKKKAALIRRITHSFIQKLNQSANSVQKTQEDIRLIKLALHRSGFFTCLDEEQINRFIDAAELRSYEPGKVIVLQGSDDDELDDLKKERDESTRQLISRVTSIFNNNNKGDEQVHDDENVIIYDTSEQKKESSNEEEEEEGEAYDSPIILNNVQQEKDNWLGIYVVRTGSADVWIDGEMQHTIGPGTLFGEGAVLFNRLHSSSVAAAERNEEDLQCWVVGADLFYDYVLKR